MKEKLKKNKVLLVLAFILIVCFIFIVITLFKYFYTGLDSSKYGDRLEGKETVELHSNLEKEIKDLYSSKDVDAVEVKISGRIVYVTINLTEVKKKADARVLAEKSIEKFSEREKQFYDIQLVITCKKEGNSEDKVYPTMGYKNSSSSVVVWTK